MNENRRAGEITPEIERYLKLALAPPDEALLRRYLGLEPGSPSAGSGYPCLGREEVRWVETNLAYNPAWQRCRDLLLERERGPHSAESRGYSSSRPPRVRDAGHRGVLGRVPLPVRVALCGLAVYASLWVGGRQQAGPTFYLANVGGYEQVLERPMRGEDPVRHTAFRQGATALLAARRTTFGLFPRYDANRIEEAEDAFSLAYEMYKDPFHRAEIAFFLGKAALMRENEGEAKLWFERALSYDVADYREEAQAILTELD